MLPFSDSQTPKSKGLSVGSQIELIVKVLGKRKATKHLRNVVINGYLLDMQALEERFNTSILGGLLSSFIGKMNVKRTCNLYAYFFLCKDCKHVSKSFFMLEKTVLSNRLAQIHKLKTLGGSNKYHF